MIYLKSYKLFEDEVLSKNKLKNLLWHQKNPSPTGETLSINDLDKYPIPDKIKEMMGKWDIIYKSPYSKSFYSSSDISWTNKPDGSYRVSDHWNFKSVRNMNILHCKTDIKVPNNTHYSIGKYNKSKKTYEIILSEESTDFVKKQINHAKKLSYLKDPETIYKKKIFKNLIRDKQIIIDLTCNNRKYHGILDKYSGNDLRIVDNEGNVIFTTNYLREKSYLIILKDLKGNIMEDPFIGDRLA